VSGDIVPLGVHGSPEYVDLVKNSPRWAAVNNQAYSIDAQGWPATDFEWIFDWRRNKPWEGPDFNGVNDDVYGVYSLSFKGQATLVSSGETNSLQFVNQTYDASTQMTTVSVVFSSAHWLFGISFTNTQRPGSGKNTGLTNIKFYLPGYAISSNQLFTDRFINLVKQLKTATFRSFDTGINSYQIWFGKDLVINKWSDRSLPTDAYWPLASKNSGAISGLAMPWEVYMQICIQANVPGWFNLPVGADDEYVTSFATLLKNGNSFTQPLSSTNPIYIEFSNEVWNWGFSQSIYNEVIAKQEGVSVLQRYVERTFQISELFRAVFGNDMGTRVRFVCMWQYGNWQDMQAALLWGQQKFGKPVNYYIWAVGEAPYINPMENGNVPYPELDPQAVDRLVDSFYTSSGIRRQSFAAWQAIATFFGINEVGYESGPSLVAGVESDVTRSPRLKDVEFRYYMDNYFAVGCQTVNFFALGPGAPGVYGDWYMFEHWGEYTYGKMQGYLSVSGQNRPPLTVGFVLPWKMNDEIMIDASQYGAYPLQKPGSLVTICNGGCWPNPGMLNYLLRSTTTGTYQITITGESQTTNSSVEIWVNNKIIQTVNLPQKGGSATVSISVEMGLSTLALAGSGSGWTKIAQPINVKLTNGNGSPVVPSAPLNFVGTGASGSVSLVWANVTTATGYTVQRSTMSGGPYTTITTTMNTDYMDKGLTNDNLYYYVLYASNSVGNSALSPQIAVVPIEPVAPAAPQVKTSTGLEDGSSLSALGQAFLTWNKVPNALSYQVEEGKNQLTQQTATSYFISNLNPGSSHTYNVTAINPTGKVTTSVTVQVPTSSTPGDPTNLSVTTSNGNAMLKWLQPMWTWPEFGELFSVERSTAMNGPWVSISNPSVNNFKDVSIGMQKYCYRIWAMNGKGAKSANPTKTVCVP